ncbi:MAG: L,D-transpeptidase family protein [Gammaproteobacteria bacterium]
MNIRALLAFTILLSVIGGHANATTYAMPENSNDSVIIQYPDSMPLTRAEQDETLLDVARRFLLGQTEIVRLNPNVDRWLVKKGEVVRLSNKRILPDSPHNGITLNISEYRMYYYPPTKKGQVISYAHGIGRQDWKTPLGKTKITQKIKNPSWHPPESIRREHAANGDPLPVVVPPGPNNPLGTRALYLALPGEYRIHGTDIDKIHGIGMQITHGCVRMYPEDIEALYDMVSVGTPVYIVKQPIKVGWLDNVLYVESHPNLEGEETTLDQRFSEALRLIDKANNKEMPDFDQLALNKALTEQTGDPVAIYERLPPMEEEDSVISKQKAQAADAATSISRPESVKPTPKPVRKASPDGYYHGN